MATSVWVNIGSGNGLLPDGTKPLPEPMLTYHQLGRVAFTWWQYSLEMLTVSLTKRGLKITHLKSQPHFSGGNELKVIATLARSQGVNTSCAETVLFLENWVDSIATDALAPCFTRGGVTEALFINFSINQIFDLAKVPFRLF